MILPFKRKVCGQRYSLLECLKGVINNHGLSGQSCFNVTQSKDFPQFFHFVHASWQSHNGLINNRPSWRQWASLGLTQALWFGFGLRGLWRVKENGLFSCAFFSHVSDMHALSTFLRATLSLCLFYLLSERWRLK